MQRQTRNKKMMRIGVFFFFLAVALSACGKEEKEKALEKVFAVEDSQEVVLRLPKQVICGQEGAWVITTVKNDFIYQLGFGAGVAEVEKLEWQPEEGSYSIINVSEHDGMLYAVVGGGFFVDGSRNVYLIDQNNVARFDGDGNCATVYELDGTISSFQENGEGHVECVVADTKGIILYELAENSAEEKWTFTLSAPKVQNIRCSGEEMLCLATDTELLFFDRESGSMIAGTNLVKMGVPAPLAGYYDAGKEKLWLYSPVGNGREGLRISLLNGKDVFLEQRTELVYGVVEEVNSDAASSIRTAINTFNLENKEYYVTLRNYGGNLERMQADMAAGNGPDIIDMMDSDFYESYVKNGYLENLSPYLEQSRCKEDIIWNVLDAYKIDNGLYLFVPQFQLEGILIHPEYAASVEEWNMEEFLELVEKNKWEKDIFGGTIGDPQLLLKCMLYGRQEEFIESLLWESNQKYSGMVNPGFPVRSSVLKEMTRKDMTIGFGKEKLTVTENEVSILEDIIYNGELSSTLLEPNIWSVIWEETTPYFAGDKSVEETVHIIQSRVQLILGE